MIRMALSPGSRLGPYEILSPLGAGGMGEVYRARDARLGCEVAIKVQPPSIGADEETLARFGPRGEGDHERVSSGARSDIEFGSMLPAGVTPGVLSQPPRGARREEVMIGRALEKRIVVGVLLAGLLAAAAPAGDAATAATAAVKAPPVDSLEIVVVVDNFYDCFQKEEKCAKRLTLAAADSFEGIRVQGEMGLAYFITATVAGKKHTLLMDFGLSPEVYENNLRHLKLDISGAEALVLSHGHEDHYAGLPVALKQVHGPFYVGGPDAFLHRFFVTPAKTVDMGTLDRAAIEKAGSKVVFVPEPAVIAGVALASGEIARVTDYEKVPPPMKMEKNGTLVQDPLTHEQALIFNVAGKGLVVITSCAHSGVVNTVEHARKITGESRVLAVLGGMHLTSASDETIDKTVAALQAIKPTFVAPMHCTGNRALMKLAALMPDAYVHPSVGTRYVFEAARN
jgi:7,8-dihydropterin-6-yl-methyl-4-(beta-D-ribofuranosyl)aminobenzene 5'-phosphate synthase